MRNAQRLDVGIDAPGVRRMFVGIGVGALVVSAALAVVRIPGPAWVTVAARALGIAVACYALGMAAYMTCSSRVGKLRTRDRLLNAIPWNGAERVLDVGCGRGLMAIRAATRVPYRTRTPPLTWCSHIGSSTTCPTHAIVRRRSMRCCVYLHPPVSSSWRTSSIRRNTSRLCGRQTLWTYASMMVAWNPR